MGWVAKKKMKIQRGKGIVTVLAGDPVPEAEHWRTREALKRQNFIEWIDEEDASVPSDSAQEQESEVEKPILTSILISKPTKKITKKTSTRKTSKKKGTKKSKHKE